MDVYEKLKKIKKPVLLAVYKGDELFKLRILRPDGTCTYVRIYDAVYLYRGEKNRFNNELFETMSCFSHYEQSLKDTVNAMKRYDKSNNFVDYYTGLPVKFTTQLVGTIEL